MNRSILLCLFLLCLLFMSMQLSVSAQITAATVGPAGAPNNSGSGGMAISPARFELEMKPGTETTVVVNLDHRAVGDSREPVRIVASLNDWTITEDGRVEFFRANSRPNSASPWLIYSPGEAAVMPGTTHQIRVTVSVPVDAQPGDHLAALMIEQRPETLKFEQQSQRQMVVRYRMASVFYIKVPNLTKRGNFRALYAQATPDSIIVTPTLFNEGNSMIRPIASVNVVDTDGKTVAEVRDIESVPVLGGAELSRSVVLDKLLPPGNYTVKYRIDFQDGNRATEGVTDLVVKNTPQIASSISPPRKP